ncbi:MAG: RNA polymerase sigma factor [Bacteroidia bacterium]|nr:RNA polymerase sigma factor [Bacteroidia bacterium]
MTDEQLVDGCVKNERFAQQLFYQKFAGKMMGVCLRYAQSRDEAQDILQESFIKIFDKIQTFSGKGSLEGWVRRIVVNQALDNYRKNKAHKKNLDISDYEYQIQTDEKIMDSFAARDLLKVIQKLPTGFRTVFNLYAIEGFSHKEIAKKLDISESTSKSQYSRARSHLQSMLKSEKLY